MTTDVSQESPIEQSSHHSEGPGEQLRLARESKGFTISSLADRLKVPESYISGIEANEYDAIPGLVFARGYIRSFARTVGLSPDEIVAQFDHFTGSDSQDTPHLKPGAPISNRRHMSPVIAWSATLVIIVVVGSFSYFSWNKSAEPVSDALPAELSVPAAAESLEMTAPEPAAPEGNEKPRDIKSPEAEAELLAIQAPELVGLEESDTVGTVEEAVEPSVAHIADEFHESETTDDSASAISEVDDVEDGDSASVKLAIRFDADCWVQVRDMAGKNIFTETQKAGTTLELEVPATVQVRFGNVQGVSGLNFDGREVEVKTTTPGRKVARLVLESSDAG